MLTWSNLLDGYPIYTRVLNSHSTLFTDVFNSRFPVYLYLDGLTNLYNVFRFVFVAFVSSGLLVTLFFGLWYLIVAPFLRRIGQL